MYIHTYITMQHSTVYDFSVCLELRHLKQYKAREIKGGPFSGRGSVLGAKGPLPATLSVRTSVCMLPCPSFCMYIMSVFM